MMLRPVDEITVEGEIGFEEFLKIAGEVLRRGGVWRTIAVDEALRVVEGSEIALSLLKLGAKFMPLSYGRSEEVFVDLETLGFYEDIKPDPLKVFESVEDLLRFNWPTPLVKLRTLSRGGVRAWAKLEGFNPFSMSIKDRIGWYMFKKALEKSCRAAPKVLYEATSTNTGIALAAMCAQYGCKLKAFIPSTVSKTGEILLKIFGAEVFRSDKSLTVDILSDVKRLAEKVGALHLNQFENDANFEVHLRFTAKELDLQVRSRNLNLKGIIAGIGTSGHLSALSFYFKNRYGDFVKVIGVQPARGTSIQGIRRIESGMKWIHMVKVDKVVDVEPAEAVRTVIEIARSEGILVGLSSGAVAHAFKMLSSSGELEEGDYVLVFPDHGFKYVDQLQSYIE